MYFCVTIHYFNWHLHPTYKPTETGNFSVPDITYNFSMSIHIHRYIQFLICTDINNFSVFHLKKMWILSTYLEYRRIGWADSVSTSCQHKVNKITQDIVTISHILQGDMVDIDYDVNIPWMQVFSIICWFVCGENNYLQLLHHTYLI